MNTSIITQPSHFLLASGWSLHFCTILQHASLSSYETKLSSDESGSMAQRQQQLSGLYVSLILFPLKLPIHHQTMETIARRNNII
jgi:hypothetical protein